MLPRSAAGRAVVAETQGVQVKQSESRVIKLKKASKEAKVGIRLALHPVSSQVIISELYSGYPALECGRLFVGDVLCAVNGVAVTEVDMALQLIKMAKEDVQLTTTNVYIDVYHSKPAATARTSQPTTPKLSSAPTPAPAPATTPTLAPPPPPQLLMDLDEPPPAAAPASTQAMPMTNLLDDLVLDDDDFFKSMEAPGPIAPKAPPPTLPPNVAMQMATQHAAGSVPPNLVPAQNMSPPPNALAPPTANRPATDPWSSNLIQF
mmetsp:Transcript_27368/g.45639  ORF Transcript_27368/g.45639 Transcript_27368/m.45639 type:complete len:263 (-) Transcript_27368:270-1058(-)|eukprot:CAMPEP_0119334032 /NCGR_PEP_ID=MMETSP1333-20130426/86523_1 /TAXON_ID=418940 /ORGANISM="Scyphosphaera apsteinii, Strain RCC1455" /LENGTH=262 /DNA_ID=CAMNT_0007344245 /DNA_START=100 /DNA_END=888 /DNA_ORIENTATION=-